MKNAVAAALKPARKFQFVGGNLCLDFCNTVGGKRGVRTREFLTSCAELLSWASQAGLLPRDKFDLLLQKSARNPRDAARLLDRARDLREAIYRIFLALAQNLKPSAKDVDCLNTELNCSLCRLRVAPAKRGFAWKWSEEPQALDQPLGPVAHAAADLLVSRETADNIRQCRGENCGWLFLDSSKNHSRCWCDMRDCGNRAKVRRHRLKQKRQN